MIDQFLRKILPSFRQKRDDLRCVMTDGGDCVDYTPIPLHELKLIGKVRRQFDRYRQEPVNVSPPDCSKKLAVIVTYRDREKHLEVFPNYLSGYLHKENINHQVYVIEQADHEQPFNKGRLYNAGYQLCKDECDYICLHDIDMLPEVASYAYVNHPVRLTSSVSQFDVEPCHSTYFGGALLFSKADYEKINGFSNDYWGWGCEDDDLFLRCLFAGLTPIAYHTGRYQSLPHEKSIKQTPDGAYHDEQAVLKTLQNKFEINRQLYKKMRRGLLDFNQSGLSDVAYEIVERQTHDQYQLIKVKI